MKRVAGMKHQAVDHAGDGGKTGDCSRAEGHAGFSTVERARAAFGIGGQVERGWSGERSCSRTEGIGPLAGRRMRNEHEGVGAGLCDPPPGGAWDGTHAREMSRAQCLAGLQNSHPFVIPPPRPSLRAWR